MSAPEFAVTHEPTDVEQRPIPAHGPRFDISKEAASTTVIIPTTATTGRRASLLNAIHSAGEQSGVSHKDSCGGQWAAIRPTCSSQCCVRAKTLKLQR